MNNERFIKALMYYALLFFLYLTIAMVLCFTLTGCTSVRYVPVESVTHDSIYISKLERDSIHVHDSIYLEVKQQADTIIKTKYVQKVVYRDALRTDTFFIERVDSVQVPYPVERKLTKWESVKMDIGGIAIGGVVVMVIGAALGWIIKRKRNNT